MTDPVDGLVGLRLRPGTAVTPLRDGLHLRGRRSSVTLEGSRALPALWRMLEPALRTGEQDALTADAPAGSPVRTALGTLVAQLHTHDLLVAQPTAADAAAARWLRAVTAHPDAAATAIASADPRILASDLADPLALAAGRALARSGAAPGYVESRDTAGRILLVASVASVASVAGAPIGGRVAVAAGASGGIAFVTAPGSPEQARADTVALTARLGSLPEPDHLGGPASLTALVAGAAVQRLLCAVAGMPDPADEGDDRRILPDRPAVLVATARPPQADYHVWLGADPVDPDRAAAVAAPGTLAEALRRVAVLGDELLGVLPLPLPGALPQLPAALVSCPLPDGILVAGAARVDLARLDAMCRAAELRLATRGCEVAVGVDAGHAWGRALRRAAAATDRPAGPALPAAQWLDHPQACHWWTTLTVRLGIRAQLCVTRVLADGPGFHGTVRDHTGRLLGEAVEATAGDAAAFAALSATAQVQAARAQVTPTQESRPSGASAPIATAGAVFAGWEDEGWTTRWLAGVASREQGLQSALRRLTGPTARVAQPWEPVDDEARAVAAALHGCGFTVLRTTGGAP